RHQSPNGQWDVDGYPDNCDDQPKCEPGQAHQDIQGDVASTGYALLCFLGAGYDHRTPNKYRSVVANGLDWLKQQAGPAPSEGQFFKQRKMYHNAVAAMAIVEAYAMTQDPGLKNLAQGVIDFIVAEQNIDPREGEDSAYRLGWNYSPNPERNDGSVSGWAIMALKSAVAGGLEVGNSMDGAKNYVEGAWKAATKKWENIGSSDAGGFPYTWNPKNDDITGNNRTPIGALCAVFLGYKAGDVMLQSMINDIMNDHFPQEYPTNTYYMYYSTLAVFQAGGPDWKRWNNVVRDMLIEAQRPAGDGCFDGSWDWQDTKFHGHDTGRLLSTAYCCLSLEVYYRYVRVNP
ncbi:MAG: hypothetical protein ACOCXA_06955, partial [Planctomycetota bacterium]